MVGGRLYCSGKLLTNPSLILFGLEVPAQPKVTFDDKLLLRKECIVLKEKLKEMSIAKYKLEDKMSNLRDELKLLKRKFKDDLLIENAGTLKLRKSG